MSGIASVLELGGRPADRTLLDRLGRGMEFLGRAVPAVHANGSFACIRASPAVGRQATFAVSARGVCVTSASRLDAAAELAAELALPVPFARLTDAEMLLSAYERWGENLVEHIIGDFAFVLFDPNARLLLAATDQFGVRPVFYASTEERLLVGNMLAPLRDSGCVDTALNENAIGDYLSLGVNTDQSTTIYSGIRRLPPGHRLTCSDGKLRVDRYWQAPNANAALLYRSPRDYPEHFRDVFFRAVSDRVPKAGPIGILLSGGMDSGSVAAALRHLLGPDQAARRITGYTTVFRDYPEEEGRYAKTVAEHLGFARKQRVAEDYHYGPLPEYPAWLPPEPDPIADFIPESEAAKEVSRQGGTLFTGLGGDALLAPGGLTLTDTLRFAGWRAPLTLGRYFRLFRQLPRAGIRRAIGRRLRRAPRFLPPWIDAEFARRTSLADRLADVRFAVSQGGLRRLTDPFWSHLLSMGDPGQSGLSLEQAHPFFDTRLVDLVSRLPAPLLHQKRILREAMTAFLPREIVLRRKTSLGHATLAAHRNAAVIARQKALVGRVPCLAEYIDLPVLLDCVVSPEPRTAHGLVWAESFGYWLGAKIDRSPPAGHNQPS